MGYLNAHPLDRAARSFAESEPVRREAYGWLLRSRRRGAQNLRIRILLEQDAFARIHADWQPPRLSVRVARAFARDRDRLLRRPARRAGRAARHRAERRTPARHHRVEELRFAEDTPFATVLRPRSFQPERVLSSEVARAVRAALLDVVESGSAVRARGAFALPDGTPLAVGGKTGTGDNRIETLRTRACRLERSKVTSRSATFAFLIGDRHFGVITAYVEGAGRRRVRLHQLAAGAGAEAARAFAREPGAGAGRGGGGGGGGGGWTGESVMRRSAELL